ncbi:MAG: hypothetical protein E7639_00225 [Ruminococcaceae bacterium]|nr:hypothetical protein [Oscillospiraceae bacterium]
MNTNRILQGDERAALALRALYHSYGYTQYKMNKFEEYDLYVQNKDFLISDNVITFTDTSGKLLALKPDVTLSIVKNAGRRGSLEKVYYQENVYRVSGRTHAFREIMQVGLECIGAVDPYCIFEVLTLAAKSLATISENAVLDVSHLGIVSAVLDALAVSADTRRALLTAIGEKNLHEATAIATAAGVASEKIAVLQTLISSYGAPHDVLPTLLPVLQDIVPEQTLHAFAELLAALEASPVGALVRVDLSVVGDIGYYNGIVFKGFIAGVPEGLLSGGEYNGLMRKMGKKENAIGFAVYLDALERFMEDKESYDVDTVLLYDGYVAPAVLAEKMAALVAEGKTALALHEMPERLRYRTLLRLTDGEVQK